MVPKAHSAKTLSGVQADVCRFRPRGRGTVNYDRPKLAIFFDAENVSLGHASAILKQLSENWDIYLRRAYCAKVIAHEEILRELSIVPVEVLRNACQKNAADLNLAVDAMEELCLGISNGICIVSGDSDFTRLVQRIREKGKAAIVFGNSNTPASLRNACTAFHLVGSQTRAQSTKKNADQKPKSPAKPTRGVTPNQKPKLPPNPVQSAKPNPKPKSSANGHQKADSQMVSTGADPQDLRRAFEEFSAGSDSHTLQRFGQFLHDKYPRLRPQNFGFAHLRTVLMRVDGFHLEAVKVDRGAISDYQLSLVKDWTKATSKHRPVSGLSARPGV
jgi:hypothetical protein